MKRQEKPRALLMIVALCLCSALLAIAAVALSQPHDEAALLRQRLARQAVTIEARTEPIVLWESFVGKATRRLGQRLETGAGGGEATVTGLFVSAGDTVNAGEVVATVQGAPVVVLPGALPAYRDLAVGDSGPDVAQLHAAMGSLGLPCLCGTKLTKAELQGLRARVFASAPAALDGSAWKGSVPASGLVFMRQLPARVAEVEWQVGKPAKDELASSELGAAQIEIDKVPVESRVEPGQLVEVIGDRDRSWRSRVTTVRPEKDNERSFVVGGEPPGGFGESLEVRVRTLKRSGQALLVPAAAVGVTADGEDRIVVMRSGRRASLPVRVVADLGGKLAVRGTQLRTTEEVVVANESW